VQFPNDGWAKAHVSGVGQSGVVILDGKSVFENVTAGMFGRRVHTVVKEEVEDACRVTLIHAFVRDLLNRYDTLLGGGLVVLGSVVGRSRGWLFPELG